MSAVEQHPPSIVSPEEVASAMNAAFAEFLAGEPAAAAAALLIRHQQNVNPSSLNDFLTSGTTHSTTTTSTTNHEVSSRNGRPPTPYAVTTHTYSGKICYLFSFHFQSRNQCSRFTFIVNYVFFIADEHHDNHHHLAKIQNSPEQIHPNDAHVSSDR